MKKLCPYLLVLLLFTARTSPAQISPPGLGTANTAAWMALGVKQDLDSAKQKQLVTYLGMGRKSDPDNDNPYHKPAIFVVNEEFYHQFKKHWQYSVALSYRRQNEYAHTAPFEKADPGIRQELRAYGRLSYLLKKSRVKFVGTLRQEFRSFFAPGFTPWREDMQLRTRLRAQLTLELDAHKTHRLVGSAEALFASSHENAWSAFAYGESRFCAYYSLSPQHIPFMFDLGYMKDVIGQNHVEQVDYIAVDVIWLNPFVLAHHGHKGHEHVFH